MNPRQVLLVVVAGCLYSFTTIGRGLKWAIFWLAWYVTGGARWFYLFRNTAKRDLRLLYRGLLFMGTMIQAKHFNKNIIYYFRKTVKKHPNKIMYINANTNDRWTFGEMEELSNRVANFFLREGYAKGDTIALLMENRPEYVAFWVGLAKVGITPALINTNLKKEGLVHTITIANSKAIIYGLEIEQAVKDIHSQLLDSNQNKFPAYVCRNGSGLDKSQKIEIEGAKDLDLLLPKVSSEPEPESISKSIGTFDPLFYIYTSGTTGLPKAVIIKHFRQVFAMGSCVHILKMRTDDIVYAYLPLYHSSGGQLGIGASIMNGTTTVIKKKFSASAFWTDCVKFNVTATQYIGEIARYLLAAKVVPEEKQHHVRIMFGNGLRPQIWENFTTRFNIPEIAEFYGATEGNSNIVNLENKVGKVGFIGVCYPQFLQDKLLPLEVIRVDKDTVEPIRGPDGFCEKADPGEAGEFIGKIVMGDPIKEFTGYQDKEATKKKILKNVFKKGDVYFRSGDILVKDEFGWLSFQDRIGDTFRWKGENVSTTEVEATVSNILKLNGACSYGVGIPNTDGRASMIAILGKTSAEIDLDKLYRGVEEKLPAYSRPIFVRLVPQLQMTGTFKLKKNEIQAEGFDRIKIKDEIFFLDTKQKKYIPLTEELYKEIMNGNRRL